MGAKAKVNAACGRMVTVLPQCGFVRGNDLVATRPEVVDMPASRLLEEGFLSSVHKLEGVE